MLFNPGLFTAGVTASCGWVITPLNVMTAAAAGEDASAVSASMSRASATNRVRIIRDASKDERAMTVDVTASDRRRTPAEQSTCRARRVRVTENVRFDVQDANKTSVAEIFVTVLRSRLAREKRRCVVSTPARPLLLMELAQ